MCHLVPVLQALDYPLANSIECQEVIRVHNLEKDEHRHPAFLERVPRALAWQNDNSGSIYLFEFRPRLKRCQLVEPKEDLEVTISRFRSSVSTLHPEVVQMPPRKSAQADADNQVQATTSAQDRKNNVSEEVQRSLARWTDEQEIALLKGIVRWKPVGSLFELMEFWQGLTSKMFQACTSTFA
jgi:hypothetical protein